MSEWRYIINPFPALAKESRELAIEVLKFSDSALHARDSDPDPWYHDNYVIIHAAALAVGSKNVGWSNQKGDQKADTLTVKNLLKQSKTNVNKWWKEVANVFDEGSPEFMAIFPDKRKKLNGGKVDNRVVAFQSLDAALTGIVALAATKAEVHTYADALDTARNAQLGEKSGTGTDSGLLNTALNDAMNDMWGFYGACIQKFRNDSAAIKGMIDTNKIQSREQSQFNRYVKKSTTAEIAKRTLATTVRVRIKVLSTIGLRFFIAVQKSEMNPTVFLDVHGMTEVTVLITVLGNAPDAKYIRVTNLDGSASGQFEFEIL